jgi:hypothetical protein
LASLSGNHGEFRRWRILKGVIGNNLQTGTGADGLRSFRNGIQFEQSFPGTWLGRVLKNFPGAAKIDNDRAIRDYECNRD